MTNNDSSQDILAPGLDKKAVRRHIRERLCAISTADMDRFADRVFARIEATEQWRTAHTVGLYCALPDEMPTDEVIRRWSLHKRVVLPVVEGEGMSFHEFVPHERLERGAFGIAEPSATPMVDPSQIELIVVPGVAFDRAGNRLGRGKGYYDRYLAQTVAYRIGVCTPSQLLDSVECQPHDQSMDMVISGEL